MGGATHHREGEEGNQGEGEWWNPLLWEGHYELGSVSGYPQWIWEWWSKPFWRSDRRRAQLRSSWQWCTGLVRWHQTQNRNSVSCSFVQYSVSTNHLPSLHWAGNSCRLSIHLLLAFRFRFIILSLTNSNISDWHCHLDSRQIAEINFNKNLNLSEPSLTPAWFPDLLCGQVGFACYCFKPLSASRSGPLVDIALFDWLGLSCHFSRWVRMSMTAELHRQHTHSKAHWSSLVHKCPWLSPTCC